MKETKKFDKWIGILSISVICIVAIVFVLVVSDTHLAKGTYGASCYAAPDATRTFVCPSGSWKVPALDKCCPNGSTSYQALGGVCEKTDGNFSNTVSGSYQLLCNSGTKLYENKYCCPEGTFNSSTKQCCQDNASPHTSNCENIGSEVDTDTEHCTCVSNPMAGGNAGVWSCTSLNPSSSNPSSSSSNSSAGPSSGSGVQVKTTGCYSCNSGVRYLTAGSTFPESCNTAAPISGYAMNGYDSYCHRVETPSASGVAPDPSGVVYVYFSNAEGTETKKTCKTGTDGKLDSNCISSLSGICGSWSTSYCPNHTCDSNNTQTLAYSTSGLANVKFTVATRFYCFAGSSVHPENPSTTPTNPSTSSVKPNSSSVKPSSSSVKPSLVSSKSESTVPSNPKTGTTGIIIAWIIGLFAIGYSFWYFKRTSTN